MAAVDVDMIPQDSRLFFCHECTQEVYPKLPEFTCSQCNSGFIEELDEQGEMEVSDEGMEFDGIGHVEERQMSFSSPNRDGSRVTTRTAGPHIMFQIGGGPTSMSLSHGGSGSTSIDSFIQQVFNNLGVQVLRPGGGTSGGFNFGGSFGDYAWGQNGLDNIITQLLNQLENTGPPPAEKVKIESIPIHRITEKDVEEKAECAVCRCEYSIGEETKRLPCTHFFHSSCLDPWLVLHDSCPICRCNLDGQRPNLDT